MVYQLTHTGASTNALLTSANQNLKKNNFSAVIAPTVNDDTGSGYSIGSRWHDVVAQKQYVCWDASTGAADWQEVGGSGGVSTTQNNVIVDSTLDEVAGKVYNTIATALVYIATQTPATDNIWTILISENNSEDFTLPKYVNVVGYNNPILSGNIESAVVLTDTPPTGIYNCIIEDFTLDSGTEFLCFNNCTMNATPTVSSGFFLAQNCTIIGGSYPAGFFSGCRHYAGDAEAAIFENCNFFTTSASTLTNCRYINCDVFDFYNYPTSNITIVGCYAYNSRFGNAGLDLTTTNGFYFSNCVFDDSESWATTANTVFIFINCTFLNTATFDLSTAPDVFFMGGCVGSIDVQNAAPDDWDTGTAYRKKGFTIPIEWFEDGSVAPGASELYSNSNKNVRIRKFSGTADNDVNCNWDIPIDASEGTKIRFRVKGIITEATGPSSEGVVFSLETFAAFDGADSSQSYGTAVNLNSSMSYSQNDYFVTDWSDEITTTNLAEDTLNQMKFSRLATDGSDTYAQDIGIVSIDIMYISN